MAESAVAGAEQKVDGAHLGSKLLVFCVQCASFGSSNPFNDLAWVLHPSLDICTIVFIAARIFFLLR